MSWRKNDTRIFSVFLNPFLLSIKEKFSPFFEIISMIVFWKITKLRTYGAWILRNKSVDMGYAANVSTEGLSKGYILTWHFTS